MGKNKLIKNATAGILQFVLTALLTLLSVPVFIHKLGLEQYGIFAIISVIGNLNLLTNFGLNGALMVYVAKQGKGRESDHDIIATQTVMFAIMAVFVSIILIFKGSIISDLFSIPAPYAVDSEKLLIYLAIANALLLLGQTYTAVIDAQQKIHLTNISQFIYSLIYWLGMIAAVSLGGGLVSIGMIAMGAAAIWFVLVFVLFRLSWGKVSFQGLKSQLKKSVRKQLSYGGKIYLSGMVGFMFEPLSKILLSNFIGLNAVGLFEIGIKIKGQINGVLSKAFYPFLPFIANSPDNDQLKSKVFDLAKKIQLMVLPVSLIIAFVLTILTKLWLGPKNYEQTSVFAITLTITMLLFSPPILPIYQYFAAKNKAEKNIWIQFSSVMVNAIVFFSFYKILGLYTILVSNTFAFIASYSLGYYYQYKYLGVHPPGEWSYYSKLIIYFTTLLLACALIRYFMPVSLLDLIIYPVMVGLSFILFVRSQQLISKNDLELYFGTIPFLKKQLTLLLTRG